MTEADVKLTAKSKQQWIDLIRNERRIEFAGEGIRYDDIIRWKIADKVLNQPAMGHTRKINNVLQSLKIEDRRFNNNQYKWSFHESTHKVEPKL